MVLTEKAFGWVGGWTSTIVTSESTADSGAVSTGIEDFGLWSSEVSLG